MIASFLTFLVGGLIFLFLFWKRLKEDYASEIIFKCAFSILFGVILFWFLALKFAPGWFLWLQFAGGLIGLTFGVIQLNVRFYESLEAYVVSFLPAVAGVFLKDSVVNSSFLSFTAFLVMLIIIFIYYFLDLHYKEFNWYKSGRIGFSGLGTLGIIFLTRSLIAIFHIPVLSFVGKFEAMLSGVLAFLCFLMILNLGRKIE